MERHEPPPPPASIPASHSATLAAHARSSLRYLWKEWVRPLALPLLFITAAKSALADINPVPTGSMIPTVLEGDVVFVNKLAYDLKLPFTLHRLARWAEPDRGDIVVCFSPEDETRLLKRVVGLPGDIVEMRNETLLINGAPLNYTPVADTAAGISHLPPDDRRVSLFALEQLGSRPHAIMVTPRRPAFRSFGPLTVPDDAYFLLGDNRDNSHDSRIFGFVARERIIGEALGIFVSGDLNRWLRPRLDRFFAALD